MADREELSKYLHTKCPNVYFQPGKNTTLKYPCLVYEPNDIFRLAANNKGYVLVPGYQVTYITKEKSSLVPEELLSEWLPSSWSTYFVTDNLYHTVVVLY